MNAYIMVRTPTGNYKGVDVNSIEQTFVNSIKGETTVIYSGEFGLEFGIVEEVKAE